MVSTPKGKVRPLSAFSRASGWKIVLIGSLVPLSAAALAPAARAARSLPRHHEATGGVASTAPVPGSAAPPRGTLTGRILGEEGAAVSHTRVMIFTGPSGVPVREALTDAQGAFGVTGLLPGVGYYVVAEHEEAGLVESVEITLGAERGESGLVLVLARPREATFSVVDIAGHPVPRANVKLEATSPWFVRVATADEKGEVVLRMKSEERGTLSAWARGYATARLPALGAPRRIVLMPAPSARGKVVDPDGRPVGGARVVACEGQESREHLHRSERRIRVLSQSAWLRGSRGAPRVFAFRTRAALVGASNASRPRRGGQHRGPRRGRRWGTAR